MTTPARSLVERYALPPGEIEALSLQRVRATLGGPAGAIVERMVYAAGDPALAAQIHVHPDATAAGVAALRAGKPVVTDVRMVAVAVNQSALAALGGTLHCAIDDPAVAAAAQAAGLPRAVLAMRSLAGQLDGGVAVIGNAPTALLALLDLVDAGEVRPALIIGTPVGFVAAAESKQELMARAVPYITVAGTRGGSALAAAAVNALLRLAADA
jgi:precorrin-8X/cobalt-precorrin-8 methylmutase